MPYCSTCSTLNRSGRHLCPATATRPFLKWVGGKTQLLSRVFRLFPRTINNYYEPFLGGGSVLLALLSYRREGAITVTGRIVAGDRNAALIGLYKNIQIRCEEVIQWLEDITRASSGTEVSEERYYKLRDRFNALEDKSCLEASALMLILNKTGFRGMYREGPRGFNIPYGNYKAPGIFDAAHLHEVADLIRDVEFCCLDYKDVLGYVDKTDDFVYLDPPYVPETATSFVGYTVGGFSDHECLFDCIKKLPCCWLMSNSAAPAVRTAFEGYTIREIEARRAINSKNPAATAAELLVRSRSAPHAS